VEVLTAHCNVKLLIEQALEFKPNVVIIGEKKLYRELADTLEPHNIKVYAGAEAISEVTEMDTIDLVVVALVGFAGLKPTLHALQAGKPIAIANKETLVVAGEIAREKAVNIYPIDSEHSAIFQCLAGEFHNPVELIYLTASGGPFRGKDLDYLATITKEQALKHPNWSMGSKVTIDSASMMNKGLEIIEAKWLFGLRPDQIKVVIHPESIIHSLVQFEDGSLKAQMGLPDMRLPIQYALSYPERLKSDFPRFNFANYAKLTFEEPDIKTFRNLALAFEALDKGGNMPCILNASNEVVVHAFLKDQIKFVGMPDLIEKAMSFMPFIKNPTYEDYVNTDKETRVRVLELIKQ
jgi:1-deoxy-D-xylulose-5-phosphate reductoisomerase